MQKAERCSDLLVRSQTVISQRSVASILDQCSLLANKGKVTENSEKQLTIKDEELSLIILPSSKISIDDQIDQEEDFPTSIVFESPKMMQKETINSTTAIMPQNMFAMSQTNSPSSKKIKINGKSGKRRQNSAPPNQFFISPSSFNEKFPLQQVKLNKGEKQQLTQRWLMEQGVGEDKCVEPSGLIPSTNSLPPRFTTVATVETLEIEKHFVRVNEADEETENSNLNVVNDLSKSAHSSLTPSFVGMHGEDICAALASSDIGGGFKFGTEDHPTRNDDLDDDIDNESPFRLSEVDKPQASLGFALSFLVLFNGKEGRFWISERYLNRFTYDHLIRLCIRSTSDPSLELVNDEIQENLHIHIVLSDHISEGLGLLHQSDGLNLIQVERWDIGRFPFLQYLLFKNFLLLVAEREGLIRILCSDKRETLPLCLTASKKFWQNCNQEESAINHEKAQESNTVDLNCTVREQDYAENRLPQNGIESDSSCKTPTQKQRKEKSTQAESISSSTVEVPVSPSDRFLRSVRGLSSLSYTFSSLEHALDDLVAGSEEEQIISPNPIPIPFNRRPLSVPNSSFLQVKDTNLNQSSRDRCLSSRFSEESDREQLNDEIEEEKKNGNESDHQKNRTLLARIPSISKRNIKIGLNGIYNCSRSNSDACSTRTTNRSIENDSQSLNSNTSKSSSFLIKVNAQRQALGNKACKTIQRFATQKMKKTYNAQWTGYTKRPHTSAGESYDRQETFEESFAAKSTAESLHASPSSSRRRAPPPMPLDLSKNFKQSDKLYQEIQSPSSPILQRNASSLDQNKENSPALSTPSISMPSELLNRLQESHYSTKPLPAVPCDVLDDCQTIDATNTNVQFLLCGEGSNKISNTPLEELCEQGRSGTKISLQPDRDEDSDSSHQTSWSNLSTRTFYQDNNRVIESVPSIGASPSFTATNSSTSSLPGINLSRLIPFRARMKDFKPLANNEKHLDQPSDVWTHINSHRSPMQPKERKMKGETKDSFYHRERNDSIEDVARNPGKPLLLPLQEPLILHAQEATKQSSINYSSMTNLPQLSKSKGVLPIQRLQDDHYTASDYSNSSPMTYCFASNDMNTPSSITSSFTSTQHPAHGWKRCSENCEPAVRDCVSSLSTSAPTFTDQCPERQTRTSSLRWQTSTKLETKKSMETFNRFSNDIQKEWNENQSDSISVIYSSSKKSKKRENTSTSDKSVHRTPTGKKGISASRSFDLLRRNVTISINKDSDGSSIGSKQEKMRRKSSLGLQQFHQNNEMVNVDQKDSEERTYENIPQASRATTLLRKFRMANSSHVFNGSSGLPATFQRQQTPVNSPTEIHSEVSFCQQTSQHIESNRVLKRSSQTIQPWFGSNSSTSSSSSPWTLVSTNLDHSNMKGKVPQHYRKKVTF